jgi:hypothetical protein
VVGNDDGGRREGRTISRTASRKGIFEGREV